MEGAATTIDFGAFITALTGTITPGEVITVLAAVVGVGMAFFLMWLGIRKAISSFTAAVAQGKIKI